MNLLNNIIAFLISAFFLINFWSDVLFASEKEISWTVPAGVNKIKVISVRDGDTVMNYTFNVEPGQIFKVETVE